jgi:UDP-glucose 4-epimerase
MKVLITGGAGFIGSSIAEELLKENIEVVIVDNLITGKERNVPREAVLYKADICDNLDEIFMVEQPDYVIHQAAQVSVSASISDPVYDGDENIVGTINLLKTCVRHKTKKFIFASTAALYGNPQFLPVDETHPVVPISPYGLSKHCAELYIKLFSNLYDLPYTILRYANVYGIRQDANGEAGVVAIFIEKLLSGQTVNIYGDGLQTRDFIYVKDVARANVAALYRGKNETINISYKTRISIQDIIAELEKIHKNIIPQTYLDERPGDIRHSILSNDKAKDLLNWNPKHSFSAGLRETFDYCQLEQVNIN